jgi:hypothetical protein
MITYQAPKREITGEASLLWTTATGYHSQSAPLICATLADAMSIAEVIGGSDGDGPCSVDHSPAVDRRGLSCQSY